jgi:hypothetical protein
MIDINTVKPLIQNIFKSSGKSMLSKSEILSKVMQSSFGTSLMGLFKGLPDKKDYTQESLTEELKKVDQKQGVKESATAMFSD